MSHVIRALLALALAVAALLPRAAQAEPKIGVVLMHGKGGSPERVVDRLASALEGRAPLLWIVAKHDYPGLRRANVALYSRIAPNSLSAMYEPNSNHMGAPSASIDEILRWTAMVAQAGKR